MNPAIPKSAVWASETIPPYAERKIRLAAAIPKMNVWVRIVCPVGAEDGRAEHREHERAPTPSALDCCLGVQRGAQAALPKSPCGRKASTSAMSANVRTIEYWVQHSIPVVGRYDGREGEHEGEQDRARGRAEERAHAADDHDHERVQQPLAVLSRRDVRLRGADDSAEGGERRADDEGDREGVLDVDPQRRRHLPVVHAGADDHPRPGPVEPEPEGDAHGDADREHHEARQRVLDAGDVQVDAAVGPARPGEVDRVAAEALRPRDVRGKWAMIWSATITEIAIVISAWRRSCPWFQRRRPAA